MVAYFFNLDMNDIGLNDNDDGFEETIRAVNTALNRTRIPGNVQAILDDAKVVGQPEVFTFVITEHAKY